MRVAYITHPSCLLHDMGAHHPEQPARLSVIRDRLISTGLDTLLLQREAPRVDRAALERVHAPTYVEQVFRAAPAEGLAWLDPDTAMNPHSLEAALHAAGAGTLAVDLVMAGEVQRVFCAVRPPGHHAERDRAMGFCFFDNVAVAASHALTEHSLERVAILDFDVHHGNGTEDIFRGHQQVLFCSSFQHPFYPGSGANTDVPNIVNVPLPAGTDGAAFRAAVSDAWFPAVEAFKPQMILVSAGFDAHAKDPLAQFRLREDDFKWITEEIVALADRHAQGRVVSFLEGGYDLHALAASVAVHIKAML